MNLREYFISLYEYNRWANGLMLEAAAALTSEQLFYEHGHSWGSVHGVLVHMMGAEWLWLHRWQGESPKTMLRSEDFPTLDVIRSHWGELEGDLRDFVDGQTEESLARLVTYTNTKGNVFTLLLWQLMAHLANHGTHHRGELAAMFALLGVSHPEDELYRYYLSMSGQM